MLHIPLVPVLSFSPAVPIVSRPNARPNLSHLLFCMPVFKFAYFDIPPVPTISFLSLGIRRCAKEPLPYITYGRMPPAGALTQKKYPYVDFLPADTRQAAPAFSGIHPIFPATTETAVPTQCCCVMLYRPAEHLLTENHFLI